MGCSERAAGRPAPHIGAMRATWAPRAPLSFSPSRFSSLDWTAPRPQNASASIGSVGVGGWGGPIGSVRWDRSDRSDRTDPIEPIRSVRSSRSDQSGRSDWLDRTNPIEPTRSDRSNRPIGLTALAALVEPACSDRLDRTDRIDLIDSIDLIKPTARSDREPLAREAPDRRPNHGDRGRIGSGGERGGAGLGRDDRIRRGSSRARSPPLSSPRGAWGRSRTARASRAAPAVPSSR